MTATTENTTNKQQQAERNLAAFHDRLREAYGGEPVEAKGRVCIDRLKRYHCLRNPSMGLRHECLPPDADHASLWSVNGRPVAFVSQPYAGWLDEPVERRETVRTKISLDYHTVTDDHGRGAALRWAEDNGFDLHLSDASWYRPGETILAVYTLREGE